MGASIRLSRMVSGIDARTFHRIMLRARPGGRPLTGPMMKSYVPDGKTTPSHDDARDEPSAASSRHGTEMKFPNHKLKWDKQTRRGQRRGVLKSRRLRVMLCAT